MCHEPRPGVGLRGVCGGHPVVAPVVAGGVPHHEAVPVHGRARHAAALVQARGHSAEVVLVGDQARLVIAVTGGHPHSVTLSRGSLCHEAHSVTRLTLSRGSLRHHHITSQPCPAPVTQ